LRAKASVKTKYSEVKSLFRTQDKLRLFCITVVAGLLCICLVIGSAYSASIKFDVNQMIKENNIMEGEIQNLTVKIKQASNITTIEDKASNDLGMIYPSNDQYVYVGTEDAASGAIAMIIKDQAYN